MSFHHQIIIWNEPHYNVDHLHSQVSSAVTQFGFITCAYLIITHVSQHWSLWQMMGCFFPSINAAKTNIMHGCTSVSDYISSAVYLICFWINILYSHAVRDDAAVIVPVLIALCRCCHNVCPSLMCIQSFEDDLEWWGMIFFLFVQSCDVTKGTGT